ncbi:MAG: CsgG/HfaB family protein [Alphaproteobacteria bacterium]|nr:CsgG/HfaB family protein [Alphaproteobacteria bacterium]
MKSLMLVATLTLLCGCSSLSLFDNPAVEEAHVTDRTRAGKILANLPAPEAKVPVAVYDFQDQTGQFKNNGAYTEYSSAVTKGGYSILIKALLDTGNRRWFDVAERGALKNLLQERQLIKIMRGEYAGPKGEKLSKLPPLIYGGVMLEGGIVSYDSNILTGGLGAVYMGIGGTMQYRRDLVTIYLRAVSVQSGEVLLAVNSSKTIYSTSLDANFLRYLTVDNLFQSEGGVTMNEPTQFAVQQAIETAVYSLIMEGAINHLWTFADPKAGKRAIDDYLERRDGTAKPDDATKTAAVSESK